MKMKKIMSALIALSMVPTVAIPSAFAAQGKRYDFNDVVKTTEKYFPSLNINTNASSGNMTYEQATFDGAQVIKASMNAPIATESHTWENVDNMEKVVIQARMGINGEGNEVANLPRHMGIRPIFNKADGGKGWDSSGSNLAPGIRIEQSRYWQIEGWNPHQAAGGDLNKDGVADTQLGYKIEDGKLYEVGYVYDRANKIYKAYVITNNGEVIVKDNSSLQHVKDQRYLGGVTLYTRSDTTYKTGKSYYDYLYIDEAEALSAKTTPANGEEKVSTATDITLNFNYVLDPAVAPVATLKAADGTVVPATVTVKNGKTVTVDPSADLAKLTDYTLTVQAKDLLGQSANVVVNFETGKDLKSVRYDFNNVVTTTGKYFPSLNINTGASDANMTYEQATFDGAQVLKSTMNDANGGREAYTWESIPDMDKVVIKVKMGIDSEGNAAANLPRHMGIRPIFNKENGSKGWDSSCVGSGIRIEQSRYWQIEGANPSQVAGADGNDTDTLPDTQLGYRIEDGKLYEAGYVYDRTNKIYKAYVITNNGEVIVRDVSSDVKFVGQQRYLSGVTLYTRSDSTYRTGKAYYDYLYIDEADDFVAESSSVANGTEGVAINGEFKFDYNYVIDPANLGTAVFTAKDGSTVAGTVTVSNGRTLTVTPASDLKGKTNYTLTVTGTKDLLGQSAKASVSFKTVSSAMSMHFDFNDVVTTTEKYFPTYNMNTQANAGNMTYSQGTFAGEKVLKAQMNAPIATEANTWEAIPDTDRLVIQARMGIDAAGNASANLQRHMGIRPIFDKEDGNKGWGTSGENLGEGIRIENGYAWRVEGKNPSKTAGVDTKFGYKIEDGKLYDVGYVYDRVNKIFKAYVITNNGETYVYDNSAYKHVQSQRHLGGITIYSRSNASDYNTGKGYYDYLYIDEAEEFEMEAVSVADGASNVSVNGAVEFTYNYVIDPQNVGTAVFTAKDGSKVTATVSTFNGKTLVVKPSVELKGSTEYTLTVTGTKDLLGQSAKDAAVVFTTEPVAEEVIITAVNMGDYQGKAWDVVIKAFDRAKSYIATFIDNEDEKTGEIGFENVEADGGSVAFAIFLHTQRANVALDITRE